VGQRYENINEEEVKRNKKSRPAILQGGVLI
jgi:hypothetical protein